MSDGLSQRIGTNSAVALVGVTTSDDGWGSASIVTSEDGGEETC